KSTLLEHSRTVSRATKFAKSSCRWRSTAACRLLSTHSAPPAKSLRSWISRRPEPLLLRVDVQPHDPGVETRRGTWVDFADSRIVARNDMIQRVSEVLDRPVPFEHISDAEGHWKHASLENMSIEM